MTTALKAKEIAIPAAVKIMPKMSPFFAILLSSFLSTKYIINPPIKPKKMGIRYHAFVGFLVAGFPPSDIMNSSRYGPDL